MKKRTRVFYTWQAFISNQQIDYQVKPLVSIVVGLRFLISQVALGLNPMMKFPFWSRKSSIVVGMISILRLDQALRLADSDALNEREDEEDREAVEEGEGDSDPANPIAESVDQGLHVIPGHLILEEDLVWIGFAPVKHQLGQQWDSHKKVQRYFQHCSEQVRHLKTHCSLGIVENESKIAGSI